MDSKPPSVRPAFQIYYTYYSVDDVSNPIVSFYFVQEDNSAFILEYSWDGFFGGYQKSQFSTYQEEYENIKDSVEMLENYEHKGGYFTCCLLMCISLLLTACGKDSAADNNVSNATDSGQANDIPGENNTANGTNAADTSKQPEYVYVPELVMVKDDQVDYGKMQQVGDSVCYISLNGQTGDDVKNICRFSLTDKELSQIPITWPMEGMYRDVCCYVFEQDHSVWLIVNVYPADYSLSRYLCKFDSEGKNLFSKEITEQTRNGSEIGSMTVDRQGRIYVFTDEYGNEAGIWLYTADGDYQGYISYNSSESVQVKETADGEDGGFYMCVSEKADPDH